MKPQIIRTLLVTGLMATAPLFAANADDRVWRTTTSLIDKSKYEGREFTHYDHVNPDAPKGGTLNSIAFGTYDSFNPYIIQGKPAAGINYQGGLLWDTLMEKGFDEPSVAHPLIADAFTYPDDFSQATYRLNPNARWHDGTPISVDDVKWSLETLKKHSPQYTQYFKNVTEARIDNEREITFLFDQKNNRELPLILGDLPVLPKHWWEANNAKGEARDFTKALREAPLGSGPYKIKSFDLGNKVVWERVKDYWASETPTRKGRFNVDTRSYTYFKDRTASWEAFKKGGFTDLRLENRSQFWAERYTFPSFKAGDVIKEEFKVSAGHPIQGFVLNTRRPQFQDRRVRKALTLAMNFERMNKDLFFGLYSRTRSYFGGNALESKGLPEGREKEILEQFRGQIPDEVFTEPFAMPVYESRRDERKFLKQAFDLLQEAGWSRKGSSLVNEKGEPFKLELLGYSPTSERVNSPWLTSLKRLGIDATFRVVDTAQYVERINKFDYDVATLVTQQSESPGNEQREYWSTEAADKAGSRNYAGIKDPVVDKLIDMIIFAPNRGELIAATHALDRVLQHSYYTIFQWHNPREWVARWDKFEIPRPQPAYRGIDPESWWIDLEKETALNKKYRN